MAPFTCAEAASAFSRTRPAVSKSDNNKKSHKINPGVSTIPVWPVGCPRVLRMLTGHSEKGPDTMILHAAQTDLIAGLLAARS
jgi:hypothetical protein